jgi:hypothetical protein
MDHKARAYLYLGISIEEKGMILFLSHSLGIVTRTDHDLISTLRNPSFVDPILSLIIYFLVLYNTITFHHYKLLSIIG